jgi:hypothetical protein
METEKFCGLASNVLKKEEAAQVVEAIFQLKDMPNLDGLSRMFGKIQSR